MKGLAISQPWAELIISGKKKIEVRTMNTKFRGTFYVYASKMGTKDKYVNMFGFSSLPTGVIIGKATLSEVREYKDMEDFLKDKPLHLASEEAIEDEGWINKKKYGYMISAVERLKPIPFRGMPGFFNVGIIGREESTKKV